MRNEHSEQLLKRNQLFDLKRRHEKFADCMIYWQPENSDDVAVEPASQARPNQAGLLNQLQKPLIKSNKIILLLPMINLVFAHSSLIIELFPPFLCEKSFAFICSGPRKCPLWIAQV